MRATAGVHRLTTSLASGAPPHATMAPRAVLAGPSRVQGISRRVMASSSSGCCPAPCAAADSRSANRPRRSPA